MSQREENGRAIPQRPSFEGMVAITLLLAILFALAMLSFGTTSQEILQETCRGVSTDSVAMARFLRVIFQAPVLPIGLAFFISIQMCLNRSTLAFGMKVFTWVLIGVALGVALWWFDAMLARGVYDGLIPDFIRTFTCERGGPA